MLSVETFFIVSVVALVGGLIVSLLLGFPLILFLEKNGINNMIITGSYGVLFSSIIFIRAPLTPETLPLYLFFASLGGVSGAFASYFSNK